MENQLDFITMLLYSTILLMFSKLIGIAGILSFVSGVLAYVDRSVLNGIFGLTIAVMFIMIILYCRIYKYETD